MAVKAVFEADVSKFKSGITDVTEDLDRFRTSLQGADRDLQEFQSEADSTANIGQRLHASLGAFDSVLATLGIHLRTDIGALTELATASSKTFTELGLLSTAGLAVGTAMASWEFGRNIADAANLDEQIANLTARITGMGDVAAETAAAKLDLFASASRLAGHEITNLADAYGALDAAELKRQQQAAGGNLADDLKKWSAEIALLEQNGGLENLKKAIESQRFTQEQLRQEFGLSAEALRYYTQNLKEWTKEAEDSDRAAQRSHDEAMKFFKDRDAAEAKYQAEVRKGMEDYEKELEREYVMGMKLYADFSKQQDKLNEKILKQFTERELQTGLTITAGKEVAASNVARTQGAIIPDAALAAATQLEKDIDAANKVYQESARAMGDVAANLRQTADELTRQAYLNYDVRTGARAPEAGIAGPAPTTTNNVSISVSGLLDARTISELTTAISQELMRRSGRLYPSS